MFKMRAGIHSVTAEGFFLVILQVFVVGFSLVTGGRSIQSNIEKVIHVKRMTSILYERVPLT